MRSFIFCTSYIRKGVAGSGSERWKQWLEYYKQRMDLLGVEQIFLIDDASLPEDIEMDVTILNPDAALPDTLPAGVIMFRFDDHYGRPTRDSFAGWWRSFTYASRIARHYSFDKIIHVESDAFILSDRMLEYIRNLNKGWTTFWCPLRGFAETAIQVICEDSIHELEALYNAGHDEWYKERDCADVPEYSLPFTHIEKRFKGDRYGVFQKGYPADADYICQAYGGPVKMVPNTHGDKRF